MNKTRIYTRRGDDGTTSLIGGRRVGKDDIRVEAYGTIDELNSHLGLLAALCDGGHRQRIEEIQRELFDVGASLATPSPTPRPLPVGMLCRLEADCDQLDAQLPQRSCFIPPGGGVAAAEAQVARTVCRRAERRITALASLQPVDNQLRAYINRLSDYLYLLGLVLKKEAADAK